MLIYVDELNVNDISSILYLIFASYYSNSNLLFLLGICLNSFSSKDAK